MKKQFLLFAILLNAALGATAQTSPWFQIGNEWTYDLYLGWNPQWGLHRFVITSEVTLPGASGTWMRFSRSHANGGNNKFYYARQEGEKIYSLSNLGATPVCIYDFGMIPGDTLSLGAPFRYYTVQDTGTLFLAGRMRRTQTIKHSSPSYSLLLIVEGIGPVGNPEEPGNPGICSFFFLNEDFCHASTDGMTAYFRCFADADGVYAPFAGCLVSSDEPESPDAPRVWPNPANEQLFVQGDFRRIELFDAQGRFVPIEPTFHDGQAETRIGHLPNGVYWLRCQTARGEMSFQRIVVAR